MDSTWREEGETGREEARRRRKRRKSEKRKRRTVGDRTEQRQGHRRRAREPEGSVSPPREMA